MSLNEYPKEVLDAIERDGGIRIKGREQQKREADGRFCYGVCCTWFGSIHETKANGSGLPGCPKCGGVLFEMSNEGEWWEGIDRFERGDYPSSDPLSPSRPHPGYRALWEWMRAQPMCLKTPEEAATKYERETGKTVNISR